MLLNAQTAAHVLGFAQWKPLLKVNFQPGRALALPFFCLLLFALPLAEAQDLGFSLPRIQRLNVQDLTFAQYLADVELGRRRVFTRRSEADNLAESLTVYLYITGPDDDLLRIAARCSIPYSTIATINRIQNPMDMGQGKALLLPSMPGLFIPENPENNLERLLFSSRDNEEGILLTIHNGDTRLRYWFLPGEDFKPTERAFFLNPGFYFPLRDFRITSTFGPRQNPVTGNPGFHQGLDLAAPQGTPVYAAREGRVSEQGSDPIYGNYIIITHNDNWISLYGHLSVIETSLHQQVNSGTLVGRVGSTGQSTGPHLHFELRQNGVSRDPQRLLRVFQGN
jgi:murein DD-endopeptidase MepM/ murein hydrolase activator NlpD